MFKLYFKPESEDASIGNVVEDISQVSESVAESADLSQNAYAQEFFKEGAEDDQKAFFEEPKAKEDIDANDNSTDEELDGKTPEELLEEYEKEKNQEGKENQEEQEDIEEDTHKKYTLELDGESKEFDEKEFKELALKGYKVNDLEKSLKEKEKEIEDSHASLKEEENKTIEQIEKIVKSNQEKLDFADKWNYILENIQEQDPDLLETLKQYATEASKVMENPVVRNQRRQIEQMQKQIEELKNSNSSRSDYEVNSLIKENYTKELNDIKSTEAKRFAELGISVDWDKVRDAWIKGDNQNMSLKQALYSVHGETLSKVVKSKLQLLKTQAKTRKNSPLSSSFGGKTSAKGADKWDKASLNDIVSNPDSFLI